MEPPHIRNAGSMFTNFPSNFLNNLSTVTPGSR